MLKSRSLRKAVSMLCALCMLFSVFANGSIAFAADDEAATEEVAIEQSGDTDADNDEFTDEEPEEISAEQPALVRQESDNLEETQAIVETVDPSDDDPVLPSTDSEGSDPSGEPEVTVDESDSISFQNQSMATPQSAESL